MKRIWFIPLLLIIGLTTACGNLGGTPTSNKDNYPNGPVNMTVGADPGSGFDLTMRTLVDVLSKNDIVDVPMPIENRPGGAGALWTSQMIEKYSGANDRISVTSLVMMTNNARGQSKYNYDDVTMIAQLITESYLVVANVDSKYSNLTSVLDAIRKDPGSVPVGAASDDQLPFALLVEAAGGDASKINFVAYEGGGKQGAALLSGDIDVAIAGSSEFLPLIESGDLKGLAVVGEDRLDGLADVPTAQEEGFDVAISNWRGIYGPPDMPGYAVEYWQKAIKDATETDSWADAAKKNQWTTSYLDGDDLDAYLKETQQQVTDAFAKLGKK